MIEDDFDPVKFRDGLGTRRLGRMVEYLPSCESTNDEMAVRAAAGAKEGWLVVAGQQTAGRGRRGRTWHAPARENLTFSLLLRPPLPARLATPITLVAGAALATSLDELGYSPRLKWPNDVLLESTAGTRKVAGILTEMVSEGSHVRHVILGVGINVNTETFPEEIVHRATSLRLVRGETVDRGQILAAFLQTFEPIYDHFVAEGPSAALATWNQFAVLGQPCSVERGGQQVEGVAEGVDGAGALLVKTTQGHLVTVHAGEITWRSST